MAASFAQAALAAPPAINLAHLDWLRRELVQPDGHKLAYWQIYAQPETAGDRHGAFKYVEASGEGVGCVDDVARAAIVYCEEAQRTNDEQAWAHARESLEFVRNLAAGDGTYYNFVLADGRINLTGPTSRKGLTWWTARALWATAVGAHAFSRRDPVFATDLRGDAARTVEKLLWDTVPRYHRYAQWGPQRMPAWLMGGAADVTSVAVLGLATLQADAPSPVVKLLLKRYAEGIAGYHAGDAGHFPYHAHLPSKAVTSWHGYGAHMLHALALAGNVLHDPALIAEARREADNFTTHMLINGGPIAGFTPAPRQFPQIAYDAEPEVLGLLELADATGEARYGKLAGLFASWLTGNNPAGMPMYDPATGRVWDGIDAAKVAGGAPGDASDQAGAESTIEGLLALQALAKHPKFWPYAEARPLNADIARAFAAPPMFEAEAALGLPGPHEASSAGAMGQAATVVLQGSVDDWSGGRYALVKPGEALRWLAQDSGEFMILPVLAREHHLENEVASVRVEADGQVQSYKPIYPQAGAPWPTIEAGSFPQPFNLKAGQPVVASYAGTARQAIKLDGLVLQPAVQARSFLVGGMAVVVVRNYAPSARTFSWRGGSPHGALESVRLAAHESRILERAIEKGGE